MPLNRCPNPTLEVNANDWFARNGTETLTRDTTEFHSGIASLKVVTPGSAAAEGAWCFSLVAPNVAGRLVSASAWVKGASGVVSISSITRVGGVFEGFFDYTGATMNGTWQQITATTRLTTGVSDQIEVAIGPDDTIAQAITYFVDDVFLSIPDEETFISARSKGMALVG